MNAINPNSSGYLLGTPVKKPLYDSAPIQEARIGLITAFCIAWNQVGAFEGEDIFTRYSDLPTDKYYFNETYKAGRHNAGNFYFY